MKIYTKTGDSGTSSTINQHNVKKSELVFKTLGAIDELSASIGYLISLITSDKQTENRKNDYACVLENIQQNLQDINSEIAGANINFAIENTLNIEKLIDQYDANLPELKKFILPGGTQKAAYCHVCRSICRRAEREAVSLNQQANLNPNTLKYLNRLSDFLFTLARTL